MKINFEPRLERVWAAIGVAGVGLVTKLIVANQQNKAAERAQNQSTGQLGQSIDYAKENKATADQLFNGQMFGQQSLERNIQANSANTTAANARGATSGAQFLSAQAANQGQSNQADQNLQTQEEQNKYGLLNNKNLANQNLSNLYAYQGMNKQQQSNLLGSSSLANFFGAFNDATSLAADAVHAAKGSDGGGLYDTGSQNGYNPGLAGGGYQAPSPAGAYGNFSGQQVNYQLPK